MATTHVLAGMCVGLALGALVPEAAGPLLVAGAAGGAVPDLDAFGAHRKDLHFPVYSSVLAVVALGAALAIRVPWLVVAATFLCGAAFHAVSDALGGGRSLRPWAEPVERAVYCHAQGRWWRPRRWIPYDGSPADLALAAALAVPVVLAGAPAVRALALALLGLSVPYVVFRKQLPEYVEGLATRLPVVGSERTGGCR